MSRHKASGLYQLGPPRRALGYIMRPFINHTHPNPRAHKKALEYFYKNKALLGDDFYRRPAFNTRLRNAQRFINSNKYKKVPITLPKITMPLVEEYE